MTDASGRVSALYRPFHLIGLELNISILSAALRGEATGAPTAFRGDVVATAKRDLRAGEVLDGEGGACVWGKLLPARTQPGDRRAADRAGEPRAAAARRADRGSASRGTTCGSMRRMTRIAIGGRWNECRRNTCHCEERERRGKLGHAVRAKPGRRELIRHSRESGNPERTHVISNGWVPAFAGMTKVPGDGGNSLRFYPGESAYAGRCELAMTPRPCMNPVNSGVAIWSRVGSAGYLDTGRPGRRQVVTRQRPTLRPSDRSTSQCASGARGTALRPD